MAFASGLSRLCIRNDWNFHQVRQLSTRNQNGGCGRAPHSLLVNRLPGGRGSISAGFPSFVNSSSNSVSTTSGAVRFPQEFRAGFPTLPSNLVTNFSGLSLRPKFGYRQFSTTISKARPWHKVFPNMRQKHMDRTTDEKAWKLFGEMYKRQQLWVRELERDNYWAKRRKKRWLIFWSSVVGVLLLALLDVMWKERENQAPKTVRSGAGDVHCPPTCMDVREGTSGTSADVPGRRSWGGVGLSLNWKIRAKIILFQKY